MRLARRELSSPAEGQSEESVSHAMRRLEAAESALAHVTELIHALRAPGVTGGWRRAGGVGFEAGRSVAGSVAQAVDVLRPMADERGVEIMVEIEPSVAAAPVMPVYAVVTNAVRNAIEAIGSVGRVDVVARVSPAPVQGGGRESGRASLVIEVMDDGPGPVVEAMDHVFEYGYTTKAGSSGIGLALARDIVGRLGGVVTLSARTPGAERAGAVLRVVIPFGLAGGAMGSEKGEARA